MHTRPLASINADIHAIEARVKQIILDTSSVQGQTPKDALQALKGKLHILRNELKADRSQENMGRARIDKMQNEIGTIIIKINNWMVDFAELCDQAEKQAADMTAAHANVLTRVTNFYKSSERIRHPYGSSAMLFQSQEYSEFENNVIPHLRTWHLLKYTLNSLQDIANKHPNNALAKLLIADDEEFVRAVDAIELPIATEVGHLAVQRLKSIAANANTPKPLKAKANRQLSIALAGNHDSLLAYDLKALEIEITKLAFHAALCPDKKVAIVGTARVVNVSKEMGAYLNCDDNKWSWQLNRAWLQAAVQLGYEVKLVEQHFPNIEKAILTGDVATVVIELAKEIRMQPSQYSGGNSPTATPQEILVLMDMGCIPRKNPDNSFSFFPPNYHRDDMLLRNVEKPVALKRTHSSPDLGKAALAPQFKLLSDNFEKPKDSKEIRQEAGQGSKSASLKEVAANAMLPKAPTTADAAGACSQSSDISKHVNDKAIAGNKENQIPNGRLRK